MLDPVEGGAEAVVVVGTTLALDAVAFAVMLSAVLAWACAGGSLGGVA